VPEPARGQPGSAGSAGSATPGSGAQGDPFDALGDPHRRAIVELLAAGGAEGRTVREIADALPISRPAVSRHLRLLKDAGLVADEARGTRRLYRLHDEGVEAVRAYLWRVWGDVAVRFRLAAENVTPGRIAPTPGAVPAGALQRATPPSGRRLRRGA
jgi:DNA-binding transcriptional ArsR family regulator